MSNIDAIREYRAAKDAAEGVALANGLRGAFLALVASGEMSEVSYLEACASGLDEIRERAGSDPAPHKRRAKRLLNSLVIDNMNLVRKVAKRTLGSRGGVRANLDEAVQEGSMGLVRAIECFSEERGAFSTCAGFWIRHYVQNCMHKQVDFAKQRPSCMPASVVRRCNRFRLEHGRDPVAEDLGIEPALWARWLDVTHVVSVDSFANDPDGGASRADELLCDEKQNPEAEIAGIHLNEKLGTVMAEMSPRNRELTQALFLDGRSYPDVALEYGLSPQRVHQLKGILEKRLRECLEA